jgi:hypothetical protein
VELERLEAVLRVRGPAEAVDLGFAMLRRWAGPVLRGWALGVLPVVGLIVALLSGAPGWAALLLLWLAPVFERVPLFVLSRCLFGAPPDSRSLLRALPGLLLRGLPRDLLLLRLSPLRPMLAPVALLEGLSGAALSRRRSALGRSELLGAALLMGFCGLVELGATLGLLAAVWSFLPDSPLYDISLLFEEEVPTPPWLGGLTLVAYALAASFAQVLRAAGGFGLYLARRTALEGWDVELILRQLAARAAPAARSAAPLVLLGLLAASPAAQAQGEAAPGGEGAQHSAQYAIDNGGGAEEAAPGTAGGAELWPGGQGEGAPPVDGEGALTDPLLEAEAPEAEGLDAEALDALLSLDPPDRPLTAAELPPPAPEPAGLSADLDAVLARPEAAGVETESRWQLRERFDLGWEWPWEWPEPAEPAQVDLGPLGELLGLAALTVVAALLAVGLIAALRLARGARARPRAPGDPADRAAALERLPDPSAPPPIDRLGAEALRLLEAGQPAAALALLYRGAVALLVEGGLPIDDSATEGEALRAARGRLPGPELDLLRRLTRQWQAVAYAHAAVDVDALRGLCAEIGALRAWAQRGAARPEAA